eukprot:CAMPEP_0195296770 /NCGR_PEP_ID=MMETSP0707-20130614/20130_1 /TAXON_ID=33640 /ORGANISM="Asterionellopsis glacialis, Strain CCMP134" /LENGTH=36 /DNA_ID= /DNA_START= /DNA_END= /DNA_ORIENTATION=
MNILLITPIQTILRITKNPQPQPQPQRQYVQKKKKK